MSDKTVEILTDKSALVERARDLILSQLQTAIESRGLFTIALAGGSTPKPLYEALSGQSLPWSKIHVFWGDERYVAATDKDSNQLMAREAWLDRVEIPESNIHAIDTTSQDPEQDAKKYETRLQHFFGSEQKFPAFDLILLGMGDDGHTASLFPQTEALKVREDLVTVGNKDGQPRITFTIPLINHARCVMFLVAGENKRPALKKVFAPQGDELQYPSRSIQPAGKLIWLLDKAAAAELQEQG